MIATLKKNLSVWKQMRFGLFEMLPINYSFASYIFNVCINKIRDLMNNRGRYVIQPNHTTIISEGDIKNIWIIYSI